MSRETLLQFLNAGVGVWYVTLSAVFFLAFAAIRRALTAEEDQTPEGSPKAPAGTFPIWWQRWSRPITTAGFIGTSLFLAGCGFHHVHLAFDVIPASVALSTETGMLERNPWIGDAAYSHHLLILGAQFIGAPLLLLAGAVSSVALRARENG